MPPPRISGRARRSRGLLVVVALTVASSGPTALPRLARAETPQPPSGRVRPIDEHNAKKSYDKGIQLFREGSYADALVAFENAYRIGGRAEALRRIAECHRLLKHFVDAHEAYEQLLRLHGEKLTALQRRPIQQALDELVILTGTITVTVNEAGAEIEIDGKPLGPSPVVKPRRVDVGNHKLRVMKAGFDTYEATIAVGLEEQKKVEVTLSTERRSGRLAIREAAGRDVHVFVDGEHRGTVPWEGDLAAGEHIVELKSGVWASGPKKATVVLRERSEMTIETELVGGTLRVTTEPAGEITIDGQPAGKGKFEGALPVGKHHIEATLAGYEPQIREVELAGGREVVAKLRFAAVPEDRRYQGLYGAIALAGFFPIEGQVSNLSRGVALDPVEREMSGAGAAGAVGYSFGWLSVEAAAAFLFERRSETQRVPQPTPGATTRVKDETLAPSAFFGLGPRVTTKGSVVRFTVAVTPGIAFKNYDLERSLELTPAVAGAPAEPRQSFSAGYFGFGLRSEIGFFIGRTPGLSFFVGGHAWLDLPPENIVVGPDTISPLPNSTFRSRGRGIVVVSGTQVFIGPMLGVRFGH